MGLGSSTLFPPPFHPSSLSGQSHQIGSRLGGAGYLANEIKLRTQQLKGFSFQERPVGNREEAFLNVTLDDKGPSNI